MSIGATVAFVWLVLILHAVLAFGQPVRTSVEKASSSGPDLTVSDLDLTEDMGLVVRLANLGDSDLRKGTTLRIRVLVNERKISEFEHLTSRVLRGRFGNRYTLHPPYEIPIEATSRVKISVSPKEASEDGRPENNTLERTLLVFPFRLDPKGKQVFSFALSPARALGSVGQGAIRAEARWDGFGSRGYLSLKEEGAVKRGPATFGRSPLKLVIPIRGDDAEKGQVWQVSLANSASKKMEGHLIVNHP